MAVSLHRLLERTVVLQCETLDLACLVALALHRVSTAGLAEVVEDRARPLALSEPALGRVTGVPAVAFPPALM